MQNPHRILILGGTAESRVLAERLSEYPELDVELSLAGRTLGARNVRSHHIRIRTGGFGGSQGLACYLKANKVDALIVATHPFAAQIAHHAFEAAAETNLPVLRIERTPWYPQSGDHWTMAQNMNEAAHLLEGAASRVFLTIGRQQLAPFEQLDRGHTLKHAESQRDDKQNHETRHHYVIRSIEPISPLPNLEYFTWIQARGPFSVQEEMELMQRFDIRTLVTKNSGSSQVYAKLEAARALGVRVIMVERPPMPDFNITASLNEAVDWTLQGLY